MAIRLSKRIRLRLIILISTSFFVVEIAVGFYTHSLALIADAFHYLNDLIGFVIALVALELTESTQSPPTWLSFGWQRAQILGAFFNGVFLFALGVSTALQSIEKFIFMHNDITRPENILIVACIGLVLNICSVILIHGVLVAFLFPMGSTHFLLGQIMVTIIHILAMDGQIGDVKSSHDLNSLGVLIHLLGDALNNIGVMVSALVIWLTKHEGRFYADPAASMLIACMIMLTSAPLALSSGRILIQSLPTNVNCEDVNRILTSVPGVLAVHDLRLWRLNHHKNIASVHVLIDGQTSMRECSSIMKSIRQRLHALGVHSITIQPEVVRASYVVTGVAGDNEGVVPEYGK
ncbi:cation efflux protein/ zinc transporter, putative [Talaromyces stipitatus ATCC 10500]|uniref:Cation efflux protein/ zinc transporter, putative n=1 Tax=Talaromyces stipitatus (strain ATCC 10500 / CBS 375.48 / QM 6759 / NRRL 1006) TaxID=441959 RepID=B8M165_TALSN|nr:cation efflux protein/ zinc transporter, putative [Talaromyces stipitatus ATCC 10500]EED21007.1 cation efflux protein/ zinc transporter, putative [Talaromyces stipitatus ATCC 10500]